MGALAVDLRAQIVDENRIERGRKDCHLDACGAVTTVGCDVDRNLAFDALGAYLRGCNKHSVSRIVEWRYCHAIGHDQLHASMQTAITVLLLCQRKQIASLCVVDLHANRVGHTVTNIVGDFECECRTRTAMSTYVAAVDREIGHRRSAIETDKDTLSLPLRGHIERAHIVAQGVLLVAVGVPDVGQCHLSCVVATHGVAIEESPAGIERVDLTCRNFKREDKCQ